ncbi:MAG: threonine/serine dehydratase [Xanthomonadales bacterium]|nr:threonine/serine dehydratase [Gammaproteobacteria bacterium]MBT8050667.1 threonine/serine dehydratase [Gammaproteobacteria bacterium]MBT8057503.1 threonine/serine dehydratase [Gammaproteobacteria bacterium]NNJ78800.1 threonine/serine dehydratase [Xanthomonadales bacterium]NNL04125.1 threonine/serine dehydratase [Xanthomonadales bacterium]
MQQQIARAAERIGPHILHTPLLRSRYLEAGGGRVYLKLENEQHTGSFKARGALNKVLSLSSAERRRGLLTASTGNHALGFARALDIAGGRGLICLPENAQRAKVEALRHYDVELAFHGNDCLETELYAKQLAEEQGMAWVSPYNDSMVIAGQGTVGKEILDDVPEVDAVLATVGGGGLISGIASWVKSVRPQTEVIGCLPENAPEMYLSVQRGEHVALDDPPDTLSDGSAGGFEPDSITFPICREKVDGFILASEQEIADAIRWAAEKHHKIIEGAAGVALAAFMKYRERFAGRTVAIVICGGNISLQKLKPLL